MRAFVSPPCNWAEKMVEIQQATEKRLAAEKAREESARTCGYCAAPYGDNTDWECPRCGGI
jgi:hypothetical protein